MTCHSSTKIGRSGLQLLEVGFVVPAGCSWQQHFLVECVCDYAPLGRAGHGAEISLLFSSRFIDS